jgi:thiol-disulfide isomerase/thioredoxin
VREYNEVGCRCDEDDEDRSHGGGDEPMGASLMTIRVLACWALCAALVSADDKPKTSGDAAQDKPKTEEAKKPATAAEAIEAMKSSRMMRPRTVADFLAGQDKVIAAADVVLGFKDATDAQKDEAIVAKAMAFQAKSNYQPAKPKNFDEFAKCVETDYPKSAAVATVEALKFRYKYMAKRIEKVDPAAVEELVKLAKKYPKERTLPAMYGAFASAMERAEGAKAAIKFLEDGLKVFPSNSMLTSTLKGLKIIGQPIEIVGPTLEGSEFNVASLKGKVVLVDFWATWCGPCVGELPNVKAAYEKYHGKGFEIVGVSLDRERAALEKFIKERDMPWTQIIFSKPEEMYWKNPVAVKHEIHSIPATFLIGRDGKVAARNLRGKDLEKAVAEEIAKTSPTAN